jgi:hypothetical protein
MPRYFFDLCNGTGWLADAEGAEFADMDGMRTEAMVSVRSLIASDVLEVATINLAHFLAVRDEGGNEIYRLHFRDAVKVQDVPPEG